VAIQIGIEVPPLVDEAVKALKGNAEDIEKIIPQITAKTRQELFDILPGPVQKILLDAQDYLTTTIGEAFASAATGFAAAIIGVFFAANKGIGIAAGSLKNAYDAGTQAANIFNPVGLIDPQNLALLALRGDVSLDAFYGEMTRNGYDKDHANAWILSTAEILGVPDILKAWRNGRMSTADKDKFLLWHGYGPQGRTVLTGNTQEHLSLGEYVQSWNRGDMTDQQFQQHLSFLGIQAEDFDIVKKLAKLIPGPSDLIRMAVREAFNEEQAKLLDLDSEFPADFATWGAKQGLEEQWTKKYWRAHWELPSMTQAFEMYHRTVDQPSVPNQQPAGTANGKPYYNVIDLDTLNALIKAQDYAPKWRDKLLKISYNVLTRVDIRRMYALGVITEDDVERAYRDDGYDAQNAKRLRDFVIADNADGIASGVKTSLLKFYRSGAVTRAQLVTFLRTQKIPDALINATIIAEDALAAAEASQAHINAVKQYYFKGLIDEADVPLRLTALGLDAKAIVRLTGQWADEKGFHIARIGIVDLKKAYDKKIITKKAFKEELKARGMVDFDIEIYLRLVGAEPIGPPLDSALEEEP